MAPLHYVKRARKAIYAQGKQVTYEGKKGSKREGRTLSRIDRTIPANKQDKIIIQKGESYYWWQFKNGPVRISKERPKRSQLTQSEFMGWLWDLEDEIGEYSITDIVEVTPDVIEGQRDDWVGQINDMRDDLEGRLDSMPENLRDTSSSGQLLTERIEALESWASELEDVDITWDEEELRETAEGEWSDEDQTVDREEWVQERFEELKQEAVDEIVGNLTGCSSNL